MKPIETMPKNFEGFCWVEGSESEKPELAYRLQGRMLVADIAIAAQSDEQVEWFRDDWVKFWAPLVPPEPEPIASDGHKCPHCGGTDIGALVLSFWVPIDAEGNRTTEWKNCEAETEIGEQRLCYGCGKEFV